MAVKNNTVRAWGLRCYFVFLKIRFNNGLVQGRKRIHSCQIWLYPGIKSKQVVYKYKQFKVVASKPLIYLYWTWELLLFFGQLSKTPTSVYAFYFVTQRCFPFIISFFLFVLKVGRKRGQKWRKRQYARTRTCDSCVEDQWFGTWVIHLTSAPPPHPEKIIS